MCHNDEQLPMASAFRFPPVVGVDELAILLKKSAATILADRSRAPHLLPPDSTPPGSRQPLWLLADVLTWLTQFRSPTVTQPRSIGNSQRRGAPTKAERIKANGQGISVTELRRQGQGG